MSASGVILGLPSARDSGADILLVSISAWEGYTLVRLSGEGDVTVRHRLGVALTTQLAAGTPHLIVDLSGLIYIDASCMQVLSRVSLAAQEAGGSLELAAPQPLVARMMELWGAGRMTGIHDSVEQAAIAAAA